MVMVGPVVRLAAAAAVAFVGAAVVGLRRLRRVHEPGHVDGVGPESGIKYTLQSRALVLLVGDSITQQSFEAAHGWGALLAAAYAQDRTADVINRGFSGYTSRLVRRALPALLDQLGGDPRRAVLVTLLLGTNDATREGARQHVPLHEYEGNMRSLLHILARRFPNATIVVITPPAIAEAKWTDYCAKARKGDGDGRSNERLAPYVDAAQRVAVEAGALVVDLHAAMLQVPDWEQRLLSDGVHLSAEGNRLLYEKLSAVISSIDAPLGPWTLPWHLPWHNDAHAVLA